MKPKKKWDSYLYVASGQNITHRCPFAVNTAVRYAGRNGITVYRLRLPLWHTSRSAIAAKPRCSVYKLWQKYKCEKRASNIALSYGVDVDKMIIRLFYVTMLVLDAKLCSI